MRYKELEKELVANLESLKVTASQQGFKLLKKRHNSSSGILVSTAFSKPKLSPHYSNLLADTFTFCKKYEALKPQNIEELVRYCGGLKATLNNIQYAYEFEPSLRFDDELEFLLYAIESVLLKAIGATNQKPKWMSYEVAYEQGGLGFYDAQYNIRLPMCSVCWKRTSSYSSYCKKHHSTKNKKAYNSAVKKVLSFTVRHSSDSDLITIAKAYKKKNGKQRRLATKLFAMVNDAVPSVMGVLSDQTEPHWGSYAESIVLYVKGNYPTVFRHLQQNIGLLKFESVNSLLAWFYIAINTLDEAGIESNSWRSSKELEHLNDDQLRLMILNVFARFEATHRIYQPLKSGPIKGYGANLELRETLSELYHKQLKDNGCVNLSQIGREMGLNRQRVSVLVKDLKLRNQI